MTLVDVLRKAFTLLKRALNRFANVDVMPHQQTIKDPVSSSMLSFVRPPQLQMSMYGSPGGTFALPYPPGNGYHAARAIQASVSKETDGKLREQLRKRRDAVENRRTE